MRDSRRDFLAQLARLANLAALSGLAGALPAEALGVNTGYPFRLGVASGSPLPNSIVLWTRILFDPLNAQAMPAKPFAVRWEIAEDPGFAKISAKGVASALPELAHSVHVDVDGLRAATGYWYRFMLGDAVSPVGRTRTAPAPDAMPASLKMAVASCQHWEFGHFAAHRHIAAAAPDLIVFLGDYIYEWGPYRLSHPATAQRVDESFTLDQYRARYAQYKTDPDLQAAHLAAPWIVTWDDHEVANDYANDRDERLEPNFLARRAAAYQAFYEHMPLRLPKPARGANGFADFVSLRIYGAFDWGRLARLYVLDDRQYRSSLACSKPGQGGSNSVTKSCRERLEAGRSMLGREQEAWLDANFAASPARWNILAQQTLMAQNSQIPVAQAGDGRYWTDGWDGYPAARERLFDAMTKRKLANPVVLSGDVHAFYAADLKRDFYRPASADNPVIAAEFCGSSVTSPSRPQARTEQYLEYNPHLKFGHSDRRGFMLMELTPARLTMHFQALDDVRRADSGLSRIASFVVQDGKAGGVQMR